MPEKSHTGLKGLKTPGRTLIADPKKECLPVGRKDVEFPQKKSWERKLCKPFVKPKALFFQEIGKRTQFWNQKIVILNLLV